MHRGLIQIFKKNQIPVSYPSISEHQRKQEGEAEKFYTAKPQPGTTTETGHYRELSPDYILIRLDMIPRQVFYLSNLSCPVCGGVTVRLSWNLDIIRYEFCLYRNTVSLYFGIQDVPLGLNPRFRETSQNFKPFSSFRQFLFPYFVSVV